PIPAFTSDRILTAGSMSVDLGFDMASKTPAAVGVGTGNAIRFRTALPTTATSLVQSPPSVAELGAGRLFAQYELRNGEWRLSAIDAQTGTRLWDVKVPGKGHGTEARSMVLSAS